MVFLAVCSLISLVVLLTLNLACLALGVLSLVLVAACAGPTEAP